MDAGYNMAKNLQKKLPPTDTLLIQDINAAATNRFVEETAGTGGAEVKVAASPVEAADGSVSPPQILYVYDTSSALERQLYVMSLFQFHDTKLASPVLGDVRVIL